MPSFFGSQQSGGQPIKPAANTWTQLHIPTSARDRCKVYASFDSDAANPAMMRLATQTTRTASIKVKPGEQRAFAPITISGTTNIIEVYSADGKVSFHMEGVRVS